MANWQNQEDLEKKKTSKRTSQSSTQTPTSRQQVQTASNVSQNQVAQQAQLVGNNTATNVASQASSVPQIQSVNNTQQQVAQTAPQQNTNQSQAQSQPQATLSNQSQTQSGSQSQSQNQTQTTTDNVINDEFLQWWIDNAGVGEYDPSKGFYRTDAMSDYDYRIGKNLYTGYQNKLNLEQEYLNAQEELQKQTAQAQAQSYAEKVLMQKYLPELLNVQGYSGNVGMTENAVLGLNRNYNNSLNTIQGNYQSTLNDLTSDYNANRLSIDNSVASQNSSIYDLLTAQKEQEQLEWYNNLQSNIADMMLEDDANYDDINAYLEKYKDKISQSQYEMLQDNIEFQGNRLEKENQAQDYEGFLNGQNSIKTQDGKEVLIGSNSDALTVRQLTDYIKTINDSMLFEVINTPAQELQKLGYTGLSDKNIKNGTTIEIQIKVNNSQVSMPITYVDGNWYRVQYL